MQALQGRSDVSCLPPHDQEHFGLAADDQEILEIAEIAK